ncbi:PDZ domain-containing protein [Prochlorococcus sp. AH-716-I19]|nr:PDZ domain-containing protein [Prochlorococcus sp. AH-716-I19]
MKRFILPLLAALALPTAVNANVDPAIHNLCKDVSDYMGCVRANNKKEGWNPLKNLSKTKTRNDFGYGSYTRFPYGAEVNKVFEGSPADKAGLKVYDLVTTKNGIKLDKYFSLPQWIEISKKGGDEMSLIVLRGAKELEFNLKRGKYRITAEEFEMISSNLPPKDWDKNRFRASKLQKSEDKAIGGLELSEITSFCKKKASNQILNYESCMHMYAKGWNGTPKPQLEIFTHKGKTYTASRICPVGQNMYWSITSGFMRKTKVSELGCMTKAQNETFWRDYNLRKAGAPRSSGSGYDATLRMEMETKRIQNNMHRDYMNRMERWSEREFGY